MSRTDDSLTGGAEEWVASSPPAAGPLKRTTRTVMHAFSEGGAIRRFAKLWGFLGFFLLVVILARKVMLPFVFGLLIAYILAPAVRRLSLGPKGQRRLPRWVALIVCYVLLLSAIGLFMGALLPRVSQDVARVGREAPHLYHQLNDIWAPQAAAWLERQFPSLGHSAPLGVEHPPHDPALPANTQLVVTPVPDGRLSIQLSPTGVEVRPRGDGSILVAPKSTVQDTSTLEEQLRRSLRDVLAGLQAEIGNVFRLGQRLAAGIVRSVFTFFLVLMIGAFILLDAERINDFARSLVPAAYRKDYDVIAAGVNRGLTGVIRGQLIICLVNGALTYVGLLIFDVKYALLLASVATIFSLIPIFGSILSTIPIVIAAAVSGQEGVDFERALFVLLWIVGIHLVEANFLNPRIIGRAAHMHPVLVIFALVLGESTYGLTGALLAVPVASIVQFLFNFFRSRAWRLEDGVTG